MPPLHPMIVHFPIALFVVAVLFDGITWFTRKDSLVTATRVLMILSTAGTLTAIVTGEMLKSHRGQFLPHGLLNLHQTLAIAFGLYAILLCAIRVRSQWKPTHMYLFLSVIGVILLAAVGHTGGEMAWPVLPTTHSTTAVALPTKPVASPQQTVHPTHKKRSSTTVHPSATKPSVQSAGGSESSQSHSSTPGPVVLSSGDNSLAVTKLQQALNAVGDFHHSYTTYFGSVTQAAVEQFQTSQNLPVTGQVDTYTLKALEQQTGMTIGASGSSSSHSNSSSTSAQSASTPPPSSPSTQSSTATTSQTGSTQGNSAHASTSQSGSTQPSPPQVNQAELQTGYNAFVNNCQSCHSLSTATQYEGSYSTAQWTDVVNRMESYAGGSFPNSDAIVYYLSHQK